MDRFHNPVENGPFVEPPIVDDLDIARELLDEDVESDDQGVSYGLRAIAHVLLWSAEQQRQWQRKQAEATRAAEAWRNAQPPPMQQAYPVSPYQGF